MQIQIESQEEAKALAEALQAWIRKGLEASGHLYPVRGEDQYYYVAQRATMESLKSWCKSYE